MKFVVSKERVQELDLDGQIALQELAGGEEQPSLRQVRDIMAHFLVDEATGAYLAPRAAQKRIGATPGLEIGAVAEAFAAALRDGLVSPTTGGEPGSPPSLT